MSRVNLAWNGFSVDGAKALGDALKQNSSLEDIDISYVTLSPHYFAQWSHLPLCSMTWF